MSAYSTTEENTIGYTNRSIRTFVTMVTMIAVVITAIFITNASRTVATVIKTTHFTDVSFQAVEHSVFGRFYTTDKSGQELEYYLVYNRHVSPLAKRIMTNPETKEGEMASRIRTAIARHMTNVSYVSSSPAIPAGGIWGITHDTVDTTTEVSTASVGDSIQIPHHINMTSGFTWNKSRS